MSWHHRHERPEGTPPPTANHSPLGIPPTPIEGYLLEQVALLTIAIGEIMSDQDTLNALVAQFDAAIGAVAAEVAALKTQVANASPAVAIDFTAAEAELAKLQALLPPATPPAPGA